MREDKESPRGERKEKHHDEEGAVGKQKKPTRVLTGEKCRSNWNIQAHHDEEGARKERENQTHVLIQNQMQQQW